MDRALSSFPLPPNHVHKLTQAGFHSVGDLKDVSPTQLSDEMNISKEDALEILQTVRVKNLTTCSDSHQLTALDLLHQEEQEGAIVTFCEALDEMLGGGVSVRKVTEFCGAPGIGKTQIGMQLAVDVQIPHVFGGLEGEAIYIDTEGSFIIERVTDIAEAAVKYLNELSTTNESQDQDLASSHDAALNNFTVEHILSRIYVYRCHDYVQLIALSHTLPEFLKEHPKVKLIVVDSIAFHFRHDFEDMALRTRLLNGLAQRFIKMACQNSLAVVLMNQMTTKVGFDQSRETQLMPALGESWGHASTIRIVLFWKDSQRYAMLYKSPSKKESTVPYQITMDGVRDIVSDSENICT